MIDKLDDYCDGVLTDQIPSGIHLKNAVTRYLADRQNGWDFKETAVNKVINFISKLKHFSGKHDKKHFILEPWQVFIIANLYGFYNQDGTRRFQTAYLEMARKQGKTALVMALALNSLINDDEAAAEVLLAANSKDQAKIAFIIGRAFAHGYDPKEVIFKRFRSDIIVNNGLENTFIKTLAADSDKLDGYNCHFGVVDEFHSAPDTRVRDVIRSSQGLRTNPSLITITTAGFNKSLPCFELRTVTSEIIAGVKKDDSFFGAIYSLDQNDDWHDPAVWPKSNPNLDVTVTSKFIESQVQQAINSPSDEVGIKTKNLNIWCDSSTTWIPDEYVIKASQKIDITDFKGENCYIGVDLASNVDLTAVSYLFVRTDKFYYFIDYYIPSETLQVRNLHADKEMYKEWVIHKYLKVTAGNVTDYDYITHDILKIDQSNDIVKIYYDKYNSTSWAIQCTEERLPVEPFTQTLGNFNSCTKEFERLMLSGHVVIQDSPVTRYCIRNVELRRDMHGNIKPDKSNEKKKIDGVIAALQSLAAYMAYGQNGGTGIY